jgi:beta-ketoacyl-acyl-carrier-protein synthase II
MKRVVITGLGAVTPLAGNFRDSWGAAKSGQSGIGPITRFDVSDIPWKCAGEVKGFDGKMYLGLKEFARTDLFVQYAVGAAVMAAEDAGLIGQPALPVSGYLSSGGVIVGSSRGGIATIERACVKNLHSRRNRRLSHGGRRVSPFLMPSTTVGAAASSISRKLGIRSSCLGISNACASGMNAIGEAFRLLRSGWEGPVIAGGAEAPLCRLCIEGYGVTGVVSKTPDSSASRPFDRSRSGFVLSEGASILVLEELEAALKRSARIYGEIIGYGNAVDASHPTKPACGGEVSAMMCALTDAGLDFKSIDYISAHGTSTPLGDAAEAFAIREVFRERAASLPVSSVKSLTGHMLAASGPLEAAFAVMTINEGVIPPSINVEEKDADCDLNLITELTRKRIRTAMCNSFGFGGVNAVIVLKDFT